MSRPGGWWSWNPTAKKTPNWVAGALLVRLWVGAIKPRRGQSTSNRSGEIYQKHPCSQRKCRPAWSCLLRLRRVPRKTASFLSCSPLVIRSTKHAGRVYPLGRKFKFVRSMYDIFEMVRPSCGCTETSYLAAKKLPSSLKVDATLHPSAGRTGRKPSEHALDDPAMFLSGASGVPLDLG